MTGVTSASSSLALLERYLERTSTTSAASAARAPSLAGETSGTGGTGAASTATTDTGTSTASGGTGGLKALVEEAVKKAVEGFDTSTGSASDLLATIRKAVTTTLKANGIDTQAVKGHHHGHRARGAKPPDSTTPIDFAPTDPALDQTTGTTGTGAADLQQGLLQVLGGTNTASDTGGAEARSALMSALGALPNGSQLDVKG